MGFKKKKFKKRMFDQLLEVFPRNYQASVQ